MKAAINWILFGGPDFVTHNVKSMVKLRIKLESVRRKNVLRSTT